MTGIALIVGFFLLYRAYTLWLRHSEELRRLTQENQLLREEVERLRSQRLPRPEDPHEKYIEQLAQRLS